MKACSYCGRGNDDSQSHCVGCGIELTQETEPAPPPEETPAPPRRMNLNELEGAFIVHDGFSRPAWPVILKALRPYRAPDDHPTPQNV